jgi:hypothetical protein
LKQPYLRARVQTKEDAMQLIEVGFVKADEFDGFHIYKKPK